jgi:hypothetical protein
MWYEGMGYPPVLQGLWRVALGVLGAFLAVLCLAGLLATSAWPRMHAGPGVMDGGRRLGGVVAPLDNIAPPAAAYSLRRLKSSYTGPGIRLRRASDNLETDIGYLGFTSSTGAPLDTAAANAHCAATTCSVVTWYDQSGLARHVTMGNPAQQPAYIANCQGALPCARTTTNQIMVGPSVTPAAGPASFAAVARTDAGAAVCTWIMAGVQQFGANGGSWLLYNGGAHGAPAALTVWHAGSGVINSAASVINIDGVEAAGSIAPVTTAGAILVAQGDGAQPCSYAEAVWWNNYALTAGERAALVANQRGFWGF